MNLTNLIKKRKSFFIAAFLICVAGFAHGFNMFHYPYFENDEATYLAQAWSFISEGKLAPYTYWYDHAPAGWILSSIWVFLTGGLFTFGFSLNSARVFMLVIHLLSTLLLFKIAKKIISHDLGALITVLFFVISPLAIYFQRRFLLDNIMTFWLLVAIYLILYSRKRLLLYFASALAFGIAVLTKENAIFFMPVLVGLVTQNSHKHNRIVAIIKWISVSAMIISLYPLYALLKKELFPVGALFSPPGEHVSLLGTLLFQSSRGSNLPFWNQNSDFITNLVYWFSRDEFFITLGFICFFVVMCQALFNKASATIFLLTVSILVFLASGKLVINFYVIPLIPFLALCIGFVVDQQFKQLLVVNKYIYLLAILVFLSVFTYVYYGSNNLKIAFFNDETTNQKKALEWIKKNIESSKFIAIDYFGNLDFKRSRFPGDPIFKNADWFWKVQYDPEIKIAKLHNDPGNINYIMLTAEMYRSIVGVPQNESLILKALKNSTLVYFSSDDSISDFILPEYPKSHPNGNWVAIYKQNTLEENLSSSWKLYKMNFINDQGIVLNNASSEISAKDQATTLVRAAMVSDKTLYDKVLNWTISNMLLTDKNLFITSIDSQDKENVNKGTTTENDQNIAFSLILAYKNWHEQKYLQFAEKIIVDIWKYETAVVNSERYIVAGNWTSDNNLKKFTINPSYLTPYTYKLFKEFDKTNNWDEITDSSYKILNECTNNKLGLNDGIVLPPNWCDFTSKGEVIKAEKIGKNSSDYSVDTANIFMNLGIDYKITNDSRALEYFRSIGLLEAEWNMRKKIYASYTHSGKAASDSETVSHYAELLLYFSVINKNIASEIYDTKIHTQIAVNSNGYYWGDKNNSSEQYLSWLGTILYFNKLPKNLKE